MAKKKTQSLNDDGTMTYEEWEAAQAAIAKDKKKGHDDPDAGPVAPPAPVPENPYQPPTTPPVVVENNETLILTGDADNPILIVIVDGVEIYRGPPEDRPNLVVEVPVEASESPVEDITNEGGTSDGATGNSA